MRHFAGDCVPYVAELELDSDSGDSWPHYFHTSLCLWSAMKPPFTSSQFHTQLCWSRPCGRGGETQKRLLVCPPGATVFLPPGNLTRPGYKAACRPSCFRTSGPGAWETAFPQGVPGDSDVLVGLGPLLVRRAALKGPNRDLRKPPVPPTRHLGTFRQQVGHLSTLVHPFTRHSAGTQQQADQTLHCLGSLEPSRGDRITNMQSKVCYEREVQRATGGNQRGPDLLGHWGSCAVVGETK